MKAEDVKVGVVYASKVDAGQTAAGVNRSRQYDRRVVRLYASIGDGQADRVEFVRRGPRPKQFAGKMSACKLSSFARSAGDVVTE